MPSIAKHSLPWGLDPEKPHTESLQHRFLSSGGSRLGISARSSQRLFFERHTVNDINILQSV
jgi:hypothetical protein